jgi:hypothetical protein
MRLSKWDVVVESKAAHSVAKAVDAGLDDAVNLGRAPSFERRHQPELADHLSEWLARRLDGFGFGIGFIDHSVSSLRNGGACVLATARTEGVGRIEVRPQQMGEEETA